MAKFVLELELGNDAMRLPSHVARELYNVATALKQRGAYEPTEPLEHRPTSRRIRDVNGNTVGQWSVITDE